MTDTVDTDHEPAIIRIGQALWGDRWQAEMARHLDVNVNTVQKWRQGKFAPRPGVYVALQQEIARRRDLLNDLLMEMDNG